MPLPATRIRLTFDERKLVFAEDYPEELSSVLAPEEFDSVLRKLNTDINQELQKNSADIHKWIRICGFTALFVVGIVLSPVLYTKLHKQKKLMMAYWQKVKAYFELINKKTYVKRGVEWKLTEDKAKLRGRDAANRLYAYRIEIVWRLIKPRRRPSELARNASALAASSAAARAASDGTDATSKDTTAFVDTDRSSGQAVSSTSVTDINTAALAAGRPDDDDYDEDDNEDDDADHDDNISSSVKGPKRASNTGSLGSRGSRSLHSNGSTTSKPGKKASAIFMPIGGVKIDNRQSSSSKGSVRLSKEQEEAQGWDRLRKASIVDSLRPAIVAVAAKDDSAAGSVSSRRSSGHQSSLRGSAQSGDDAARRNSIVFTRASKEPTEISLDDGSVVPPSSAAEAQKSDKVPIDPTTSFLNWVNNGSVNRQSSLGVLKEGVVAGAFATDNAEDSESGSDMEAVETKRPRVSMSSPLVTSPEVVERQRLHQKSSVMAAKTPSTLRQSQTRHDTGLFLSESDVNRTSSIIDRVDTNDEERENVHPAAMASRQSSLNKSFASQRSIQETDEWISEGGDTLTMGGRAFMANKKMSKSSRGQSFCVIDSDSENDGGREARNRRRLNEATSGGGVFAKTTLESVLSKQSSVDADVGAEPRADRVARLSLLSASEKARSFSRRTVNSSTSEPFTFDPKRSSNISAGNKAKTIISAEPLFPISANSSTSSLRSNRSAMKPAVR